MNSIGGLGQEYAHTQGSALHTSFPLYTTFTYLRPLSIALALLQKSSSVYLLFLLMN